MSLIRITWLGLLILSAAMVAIASPAAAQLALRPAEISPSGYSMSQVGFGCVIRAGVRNIQRAGPKCSVKTTRQTREVSDRE